MDNELEQLIDTAISREKAIAVMGDELALKNEEFAKYLHAKQHADEELKVLWEKVKDYMVKNGIKEHNTDYIKLSLTPSGKYRTDNIAEVDDELCDIKKVLNNKKVKAYVDLNGEMPEGVESTGYVLRKKLL